MRKMLEMQAVDMRQDGNCEDRLRQAIEWQTETGEAE